ncbi:integral membrane sensor signal transduction histidine kinase [Fluviicola taffensis DSM 16823]|uniref:histidine kinase n=2 Tax=Fluviicola TaxID=332102 RepID=F2IES1_FLUTR|nr:integral membrane sensor signal transduction histidine kinase [Fluviicola taffensis DSM 16823]
MLILSVAGICYYFNDLFNYKIVALILLMTVSLSAMVFNIWPVLLGATLSAFIWNFFFIEPLFNIHINQAEDFLTFLMYFFIAFINAVLTFQIRRAEKKARNKEEKEKEVKLYNTLFNSLSHELKTPLSTILGSVDMLKENRSKLTSEQEVELLHAIDKSSLRLQRQVENLLNMSRLENDMLQLKLDWTDMNEVVHQLIQRHSEFKNHPIVYQSNDSLPLMKVDSGILETVLDNIIHNAIQYTPSNSSIEIILRSENNWCILEISDAGPGFPLESLPNVFDKFYRLPESKAGGTGLGLSIVKGFIEAHQGTVTVRNRLEGGAQFLITLPVEVSFMNNLNNE